MDFPAQPLRRRITVRPLDPKDVLAEAEGVARHCEVVRLATHIRDDARYALTAQANIEASQALAVILPG